MMRDLISLSRSEITRDVHHMGKLLLGSNDDNSVLTQDGGKRS